MNKIIVKLYTTPACPYCFTLREFLKENGVEFEEIDVSQDEKARDGMIKKSGQMGAPVVEIGEEVIVGFDKAKITKLLGLKK
jgi:glutaredoxin 3